MFNIFPSGNVTFGALSCDLEIHRVVVHGRKKCDIIGTRLRTPHFIPFRLYCFAFALHVLVGRGR